MSGNTLRDRIRNERISNMSEVVSTGNKMREPIEMVCASQSVFVKRSDRMIVNGVRRTRHR